MPNVSFNNSMVISPQMQAKLNALASISSEIPKALDVCANYFMGTTEQLFETEGRSKLGFKWHELSERRLLERRQKATAGLQRAHRIAVAARPFRTRQSTTRFQALLAKRNAAMAATNIPILTDTRKLRRSMTVRGASGNVYLHRRIGGDYLLTFGSRVDYANDTQNGEPGRNLPARPFLVVTMQDKSEMRRLFSEYMAQAIAGRL